MATITFQDAVRKSRFGRRDWIVFTAKTGEQVVDYCSAALIKQALLSVGTQGRFSIISGGVPYRINWRLGTLRLRNAKHLTA